MCKLIFNLQMFPSKYRADYFKGLFSKSVLGNCMCSRKFDKTKKGTEIKVFTGGLKFLQVENGQEATYDNWSRIFVLLVLVAGVGSRLQLGKGKMDIWHGGRGRPRG
jgi:hypothetical protein